MVAPFAQNSGLLVPCPHFLIHLKLALPKHEAEAMGRHEAEAMGRQTDLVLDASLPKHKKSGVPSKIVISYIHSNFLS